MGARSRSSSCGETADAAVLAVDDGPACCAKPGMLADRTARATTRIGAGARDMTPPQGGHSSAPVGSYPLHQRTMGKEKRRRERRRGICRSGRSTTRMTAVPITVVVVRVVTRRVVIPRGHVAVPRIVVIVVGHAPGVVRLVVVVRARRASREGGCAS